MSGLKIPVDILTEVSPLFVSLKGATTEELIKRYDPALLYQLERMFVSQIAIFSANERDGSIPKWASVLEKIQSLTLRDMALIQPDDSRVEFVTTHTAEEIAKDRSFDWIDRLYQSVSQASMQAIRKSNICDLSSEEDISDFWGNVKEKLEAILAFYPTPIWGRTPDHFETGDAVYALSRNHGEETFFFDKGTVERVESDMIYQVEDRPVWQNKVYVRFSGFDYLFPILAVSPYLLREAELQFLAQNPSKLDEFTQGLEPEMVARLKNALQWYIQKIQAN